ncbi:MAG TPA: hypothetical protein VNQ90_07100 [Chthoniobacteraceae bacterium]|nr:hypothetical protein [Chthoniobacteraceae bacterium]
MKTLKTGEYLLPVSVTARPARPGERRRWSPFLPYAAAAVEPEVEVMVAGRVGRICGAAALLPSLEGAPALLELGGAPARFPVQAAEMVTRLADRARERGAPYLKTQGTWSEKTPLFAQLRGLGFEATGRHDLYRLDFAAFAGRFERIFERTFRRHSLPGKLEVVCGIGGWRAKLVAWLQREAPFLLPKLDREYGYQSRHAFLLLVDGEVQAALFSETQGGDSFIAYQIVSEAFRTGFPLAYLLVTRESIRAVRPCPPQTLTYAVHRESNPHIRIQAETYGGRQVDTWWDLKWSLV